LGYTLNASGINGIAPKTLQRHLDKVTQLYEQNAPKNRIEDYIKRWLQWVYAGIAQPALGTKAACFRLAENLRYVNNGATADINNQIAAGTGTAAALAVAINVIVSFGNVAVNDTPSVIPSVAKSVV
jgi:hypothetical protein